MCGCCSLRLAAIDTWFVPVVQNLARLPGETLAACATSVTMLDDVCSFRSLDSSDYLDLGWAPAPLVEAAKAAQISAALIKALASATNGAREVNPAYREAPDRIWEHPVTSLGSTAVRRVHGQFQELSDLAYLSSGTATEAFDRLGDNFPPPDGDPMDYLHPHFRALCDFYATAAERQLSVLMWWD
jgi:hypothetical protein